MSSKPTIVTEEERESLLADGHIVQRRLRILDEHSGRSFGFHEKQRRRPAKVQHPKPGAAA